MWKINFSSHIRYSNHFKIGWHLWNFTILFNQLKKLHCDSISFGMMRMIYHFDNFELYNLTKSKLAELNMEKLKELFTLMVFRGISRVTNNLLVSCLVSINSWNFPRIFHFYLSALFSVPIFSISMSYYIHDPLLMSYSNFFITFSNFHFEQRKISWLELLV